MYEKSYNEWFITGENKYWSIDMEKNEKKKFKVEARIIDNKVLGYEYTPLDNNAHPRKDIILVVCGTMLVSIVSILSCTYY